MSNLADHTYRQIMDGIAEGQSPCLPEMVRMIHALSAKLPELALQELADLIKNDTVVLQKVITTANSVGYNPSGTPINSVNEAIQVIGFDRVRSLSMSLILLENSHMWQHSKERRDATFQSLCAGLMAQSLSRQETLKTDPELAFIAGALRGFGRIVMATYMVDQLRQADTLCHELPEDAAYVEVFGMTPLDLGRRVLEAAHMSPVLLKSLKECQPERFKRDLNDPQAQLLILSDCAYSLARIALDEHLTTQQYARQLEQCCNRYAKLLPDLANEIPHMLKRTRSYLKAMLQSCGHDSMPHAAIAALQHRIDGEDPPLSTGAASAVTTSTTPSAIPSPCDASAAFHEGHQLLAALATHDPDIISKTVQTMVEALRKGFAANECWVFLRAMAMKRYQFTGGTGIHVLQLKGRANIPFGDTSVFGLSLSRGDSVFIHNAYDPKIRRHLPLWFRNNVHLASFLVLCLKAGEQRIGLVFIGWRESHSLALSAQHIHMIRQLLGRAADNLATCS